MKNFCKKPLKMKIINILCNFYIFSCLFIFSNSTLGQDKINYVKYSIELKESIDNNESHYESLLPNLKSKLKQVTFDLHFTKTASRFSMSNNALSKEENNILVDIADMLGIEYYSKEKNDTVFVKNNKFIKFKDSIIFSINRIHWRITDEVKLINGFKCRKAIGLYEKDYGDGDNLSKYDLVAWFCPEINSSFGPKSFMGLEGLILELEQPLIIFKSIQIESKKNIPDLSIPNKIIISESRLYESIYD